MSPLEIIYIWGENSSAIINIITITAELAGLIFLLYGAKKGMGKKKKQALIAWIVLIAVTIFVFFTTYINQKYVRVPDVTNIMFVDARHRLISNNLKYSGYATDDTYVEKQNPVKGELVIPDTIVELIFESSETNNLPQTGTMVPTETEGEKNLNILPGDIITFGKYERDGHEENGTEDISWVVLARKNGKALVVSKYGLDAQPYHYRQERITWEASSIRQWLNTEFYNTAFSEEEKTLIEEVELIADKNPYADCDQGLDTIDNVFLLSVAEVNRYIVQNSSVDSVELLCNPTAYAIEKGAYKDSDTNSCWWWLRTSADQNLTTCSVNSNGTMDYHDGKVSYFMGVVRPAMWISIA